MLGLVGRSGWELEMGSARRCLAAAARQLKVNMKKIQINTLYNWKPMEFRGKKGEGVIERSHFLPDLLLLFAFVGVFSLPCLLLKLICFLTPLPLVGCSNRYNSAEERPVQ